MIFSDIYFHSTKRRGFKEELGLIVECQRLVVGRYVISLHVDAHGDFWIIATYHPGQTLLHFFGSRPERRQVFAHASRVSSSDQGTGFFAFKDFRVVSGFMPDQSEQVRVFCRGKAMNVLVYERVYIGLLTRQGGFTILFFD